MHCFEAIRAFPGDVGFYYRPLGEEGALTHNPDLPLIAASVIKLPIMVTAFRDFAGGRLDPGETVAIAPRDKMPSCGALTYLHDGLEVTLMDLVTLMIILSDNTATNILIDRLGMTQIQEQMTEVFPLSRKPLITYTGFCLSLPNITVSFPSITCFSRGRPGQLPSGRIRSRRSCR